MDTRFDLICRPKEGVYIYAKLGKSERDLNLSCEGLLQISVKSTAFSWGVLMTVA